MRYRFISISLILGLTTLLAACPGSDQPRKQQAHIEWRLSDYLPAPLHRSLWPVISADFHLKKDIQKPAVQKEIEHLAKHQIYINELTHNARPYLYYIFKQTQKRHLPAELALLPMVESDYDPFAYSKRGATGLWQMMPGTGSGFGLRINWWYDGRRDIIASTNAALKYLTYLHSYFGNWLLAIAAYDSGEGTVREAIRYNKRHHRPTDFWSLPLPEETKHYVPKLLAFAAIIRNPKHYGLHLNAIPNHPYFTAIKMHGQIDLNRVAKLADANPKMIRKLNPGFRRWATNPKGQYWLLIPDSKINLFTAHLDQSQHQKITWLHHRVKKGESLSELAGYYHTTVATLKRVNHLKGSMIQIRQELLIPRSYHGHFAKNIKKQKGSIAEDRLPGPKRFVHTVKPKDTLWTVAARYHIKPGQIRYWNHLGYHAKLQPKQQLVIWKKEHHYKTGAHAYTVRSGDSLSRIASHFHISIHSIKTLNHLHSNVLQIGQKINVPYPNIHGKHYTGKANNQLIFHTVRPGQSLYVIAKYYHITPKNIIDWNHLKNEKYLHVGEKLKIYL